MARLLQPPKQYERFSEYGISFGDYHVIRYTPMRLVYKYTAVHVCEANTGAREDAASLIG